MSMCFDLKEKIRVYYLLIEEFGELTNVKFVARIRCSVVVI